jgi:hypothetical protein
MARFSVREQMVCSSLSSSLGFTARDMEHLEAEKTRVITEITRILAKLGNIHKIERKANGFSISVSYNSDYSIDDGYKQQIKEKFKPHLIIATVNAMDIFTLKFHTEKDCTLRNDIDRDIRIRNFSVLNGSLSLVAKVVLLIFALYCCLQILKFIKPERY